MIKRGIVGNVGLERESGVSQFFLGLSLYLFESTKQRKMRMKINATRERRLLHLKLGTLPL